MSDEEADGYWANESDPLRAETLHFQCEPDLLESSVENYISNLKEAEKTELLQHLLDEYEE